MLSYTFSSCRKAMSTMLPAAKESQSESRMASAQQIPPKPVALAEGRAEHADLSNDADGNKEIGEFGSSAPGLPTGIASGSKDGETLRSLLQSLVPPVSSSEPVAPASSATTAMGTDGSEKIYPADSNSEKEVTAGFVREKDSSPASPVAEADTAITLPQLRPKHCLDVLNIQAVSLPEYARRHANTLTFPEKVRFA
jgi:hypothetical protein